MSKLLRANFARLFKSRVFLLGMAVMFAYGVYMPIDRMQSAWRGMLDAGAFTWAPVVTIVIAVFIPLFLGTEYSDGTIRNKLIVGHRRADVYLASLAACAAGTLMICAAYIVPYLCVGIPLLGGFACGARHAAALVLTGLAMAAAYAALYTMISMLCPSKAHAAVGCILLSLALMGAGAYFDSRLREPEMQTNYVMMVDGQVQPGEPVPNPNYVSGKAREVYTLLRDFIPGGQAVQLANGDGEQLGLMAAYDLLWLLGLTGAGVALFRRKDLK